jgi:hypothetical protein
MGLILIAVTSLDALVGLIVPHPRAWAAVIPMLIPILTAAFVIIPMTIEARRPRP